MNNNSWMHVYCSMIYVTLVNKMFAIKIRQRCEYAINLTKNVTFDTQYRFSYKNYNMKYFGCYNIYISHIQQSGYNRYFFTGVYNKFVIGLWIRPPHVVPFFRDTPIYQCSMHTYRLAVGSWRYRQLPTENRRSSVGVYQTPTRSSLLIGAIPPIQNLNRR